jgi:hypothetical protein
LEGGAAMMSNPWKIAVAVALAAAAQAGAGVLPEGSAPAPVPCPHFPDRLHAVVWRNWPVVPARTLAATLGATEAQVADLAASMGLPPQGEIAPEWRTRGYITILRRNWHLLPYEQILPLVGMTPERLAEALREDDFLFHKFGSLKPKCAPLAWTPPDDTARGRAAEIAAFVRANLAGALRTPEEPRFRFVADLSSPPAVSPARTEPGPPSGRLRYIYSYFAPYGDPLMRPDLDPYPDGLLARLAGAGVSGVWLHTVLRTLAPSPLFPEFGDGHEKRLESLRALVERAGRHGIRVVLYMNEPRGMPASFFEAPGRADLAGVREGDTVAFCTSRPEVRQWLADSLAYVFGRVPGLGGVFTITASENLTSCASHHKHAQCPRCKDRPAAEIVAEVNATIGAGVHRAAPKADVIAWDWGWKDDWSADAIARLPKSVMLQSVSEWSLPIVRGGVTSAVGEYSISSVGPGPRAARHWALAREAGLRTVAKVQLNNTWEISTVPYLPVMDLVAEHCSNLARSGVDGLMLSWSLGGYPSPNLDIARRFEARPPPDPAAVLHAVARDRFGEAGAARARRAWSAFSAAFREYPFNTGVIYRCPVQVGPANLLYAEPTGYKSTMTGIPYDDLAGWRGPYPADVFAAQFAKMAEGWAAGLPDIESAADAAPADRREAARAEVRFARAAQLHFASVANQARFAALRDRILDAKKPPAPEERAVLVAEAKRIAGDELRLAVELLAIARADSRIGFEAANQYFYLPIDLMEKAVNCDFILARTWR